MIAARLSSPGDTEINDEAIWSWVGHVADDVQALVYSDGRTARTAGSLT